MLIFLRAIFIKKVILQNICQKKVKSVIKKVIFLIKKLLRKYSGWSKFAQNTAMGSLIFSETCRVQDSVIRQVFARSLMCSGFGMLLNMRTLFYHTLKYLLTSYVISTSCFLLGEFSLA